VLLLVTLTSCNKLKDNSSGDTPDSQTTEPPALEDNSQNSTASKHEYATSSTMGKHSLSPMHLIDSTFDTILLDQTGNEIPKTQLLGKTTAVLFAANWHPASHQAAQELVNFSNSNPKDFELIFVSLCNSEAEKKRFMDTTQLSCLTIPGARSKHSAALARKFKVQDLPQLVILDGLGWIVSTDGFTDLSNGDALAKWTAPFDSYDFYKSSTAR